MPTAGSKTMKSIAEPFLSSDYTYFSDTATIRRPKYTPAPSFDTIVETQRMILSILGSNPTLKDKKIALEEHFWLKPIKDNLPEVRTLS